MVYTTDKLLNKFQIVKILSTKLMIMKMLVRLDYSVGTAVSQCDEWKTDYPSYAQHNQFYRSNTPWTTSQQK